MHARRNTSIDELIQFPTTDEHGFSSLGPSMLWSILIHVQFKVQKFVLVQGKKNGIFGIFILN